MNLEKEWEKRSLYFKDTLKGVMLASFPGFVNNLFHNWEVKMLRDFFPKNKKTVNVLDVGCGYGRLLFPLSREFKNATFYGVDISREFVKLFNKKMKGRGRALLGRADKLPYRSRVFDYIVIVTTLIYMEDSEIKKLVQKIKEIARKNALIVLIENNRSGINYISGFGLFRLVRKIIKKENKFDIESRAFKEKEIENFFREDFLLKGKRRCRLLTLFLPLFFLFRKLDREVLSSINPDINLPFIPTLYTAYIFKLKTNV